MVTTDDCIRLQHISILIHIHYMAKPVFGKSVRSGSFSVGILPYRPFPKKRSKPCIFVLEQRRQIQN